jgi:thiol:disulfide interchange protein DsbA
MNCADIDCILDEHRASELTAARRADLDAHLAECRRCAAAWLTDDALAREPVPAPRPELLAATLRAVRKRAAPEQGSGRDWWRAAAGLAAVAVISLLAATMPFRLASDAAPAARQAALVGGRDYRVLGAPRPSAQARREPIEVLAFFAYDCPVCYSLEARMLEWRARQSSRIAFVRMPVQWNTRGLRFARAFYAADALGKSRELHAALFDELRERPGSLDDDAAIAALFARFGVDAQTLQRALESPSVVAAAERARRIGAEAGVLSVPTLVIGGEVATTQAAAATPDRLFEIAGLLVECVEQRRRTPRANESAQYC